MDIIAAWERGLHFSRCYSLDCCLSPACGTRENMRWRDEERLQEFCDSRQKTWCELCLKRTDQGLSPGLHHRRDQSCNDERILKFCRRYLKVTENKQKECLEKYPWLKVYATTFRQFDLSSAKKWVREHGQLCPWCENRVERTEGCFHMQCNECATHFCYECGKELFPRLLRLSSLLGRLSYR
jgi:hypothetical protein